MHIILNIINIGYLVFMLKVLIFVRWVLHMHLHLNVGHVSGICLIYNSIDNTGIEKINPHLIWTLSSCYFLHFLSFPKKTNLHIVFTQVFKGYLMLAWKVVIVAKYFSVYAFWNPWVKWSTKALLGKQLGLNSYMVPVRLIHVHVHIHKA